MKIKLRKWQTEAFNIWWKLKKGIVKVVTGGGKTFFAIFCISEYLKKFPNNNILIVVPSIPLLDQWSLEIDKLLEKPVTQNGGGSRPDKLSQITITTTGSLKNILKKFDPERTFLIADECHRLGTKNIGEMLNQNWACALGLSATPERDFDDYFETIITPILGEIIFDYDYIKAKRDNVISNFSLLNAYAPMLEDENQEYESITKKIGKKIAILGGLDKYDKGLKILFFERSRVICNAFNRIPLGLKIIQKLNRKKWIVFSQTKKQAKLFNMLLNKNGFRSAIYNTDISKIYRQKNLQEFKDGLLDILVSCKALDEGFDYPDIDSALILSSSSSNRQRIQRLGRALRTADHKENALIVTIYTCDNEYEKLKQEANFFKNENVDITWTKLTFADTT